MISPWKSGWLNPKTISCTGPIAIVTPLPGPQASSGGSTRRRPERAVTRPIRATCPQYRAAIRRSTPPLWDEDVVPGCASKISDRAQFIRTDEDESDSGMAGQCGHEVRVPRADHLQGQPLGLLGQVHQAQVARGEHDCLPWPGGRRRALPAVWLRARRASFGERGTAVARFPPVAQRPL